MRINFLKKAALLGLLFPVMSSSILAEEKVYPSKPIRIIVPATAGGTSDIFIRAISLQMQESLKQPVIVEYKSGAGTNIGNSYVAKAPADGYTLLINGLPLAVNSVLYPKLSYDPIKDLEPIVEIAGMANVITVHPSVPANNLQELVELMRKRKNPLNYGSPGAGSSGHLAGQLFALKTQTTLMHIPYQGNAQATTDHIGGILEVGFINIPVAQQFMGTGKIKALAVTGSERSSLMPDIPTVSEALGIPDYHLTGWFGIFAPSGTPKNIISKLNAEFNKALNHPNVKMVISKSGSEVSGGSTESFQKFFLSENKRLSEAVVKSGISLN